MNYYLLYLLIHIDQIFFVFLGANFGSFDRTGHMEKDKKDYNYLYKDYNIEVQKDYMQKVVYHLFSENPHFHYFHKFHFLYPQNICVHYYYFLYYYY